MSFLCLPVGLLWLELQFYRYKCEASLAGTRKPMEYASFLASVCVDIFFFLTFASFVEMNPKKLAVLLVRSCTRELCERVRLCAHELCDYVSMYM